jgi:hypothetical protein
MRSAMTLVAPDVVQETKCKSTGVRPADPPQHPSPIQPVVFPAFGCYSESKSKKPRLYHPYLKK